MVRLSDRPRDTESGCVSRSANMPASTRGTKVSAASIRVMWMVVPAAASPNLDFVGNKNVALATVRLRRDTESGCVSRSASMPLNARGSDPSSELTNTQRRSSSSHPSRGPCAATASLRRAGETMRTSCARSDGRHLRDVPTSGGRRRPDPRTRDQVDAASSGDPIVILVNSSTSLCGASAAAARYTATVYMPGLWVGPTSAVTGGGGR